MDLYLLLAAFCASFLFTGLKAFQQLSVVRGSYALIVPNSLALSACQVFVIASIAQQGFGWIILPVGLGAGLGAMLAMFLHPRIESWLT